MKEKIQVSDYAEKIVTALPRGILLNTQAEKFDSMVIGWGHLGTLWGRPTFVVYVRDSRYTKVQLDQNGEFTVSVPLGDVDPAINRVCGTLSGRDVDKAAQAGLTLEEGEAVTVPAVREYPLTLECKVLYAQRQDPARLPGDILERMYPADAGGDRDIHTVYVGEIVNAYIIR